MSKQLHYSLLRYSPSVRFEDSIVLGILFHEKEQNFRTFTYRDDLSPLSALSPDADINLHKKLFVGIKEEVESEIYSKKEFDIKEYTRFYLNSYRFAEPVSIQYEDLQKTVESITKEFLTL